MPSSHAANWFAATMILFIYYRRSLWFMLPGAILVSFSRIYNGVALPE
jgi:membrane-associated phospholipid phosphatase